MDSILALAIRCLLVGSVSVQCDPLGLFRAACKYVRSGLVIPSFSVDTRGFRAVQQQHILLQIGRPLQFVRSAALVSLVNSENGHPGRVIVQVIVYSNKSAWSNV